MAISSKPARSQPENYRFQKAGLSKVFFELIEQGVRVVAYDESAFYSNSFKKKALGTNSMTPLHKKIRAKSRATSSASGKPA